MKKEKNRYSEKVGSKDLNERKNLTDKERDNKCNIYFFAFTFF